MPTVVAVCISEKRGTQKKCVTKAYLRENYGIDGDAHAGTWHRQVSLLSENRIREFREQGADIEHGAFGENIVVEGIDFASLPIGSLLRCGDVLLEITQIGKECHTHCAIYHAVGDCIMPREGVFARVLRSGTIQIGDQMSIEERAEKLPYQAAIITLSDKGAAGEREDQSGAVLEERLKKADYEIIERILIPDEKQQLLSELLRLCDQRKPDLILTTGSTGFAPRDIAPEATLEVADRNAPGIAEAIRAYCQKITPKAMLSRAVSVIRGKTLIINLPGSPKACDESMDCILPVLSHGLDVLRGTTDDCART